MSALDLVAVLALVIVGAFAFAMMRADRRDQSRQLNSVRQRLRARARRARDAGREGED